MHWILNCFELTKIVSKLQTYECIHILQDKWIWKGQRDSKAQNNLLFFSHKTAININQTFILLPYYTLCQNLKTAAKARLYVLTQPQCQTELKPLLFVLVHTLNCKFCYVQNAFRSPYATGISRLFICFIVSKLIAHTELSELSTMAHWLTTLCPMPCVLLSK